MLMMFAPSPGFSPVRAQRGGDDASPGCELLQIKRGTDDDVRPFSGLEPVLLRALSLSGRNEGAMMLMMFAPSPGFSPVRAQRGGDDAFPGCELLQMKRGTDDHVRHFSGLEPVLLRALSLSGCSPFLRALSLSGRSEGAMMLFRALSFSR